MKKTYCHMGEMCIGCSPQLIEGICPDSQAGRMVAELVEALKVFVAYGNVFAHRAGEENPYEKARAAIAKATGG